MKKRLSLRRNRRVYRLFGILVVLIAILLLINYEKSTDHLLLGSLFLVAGLLSITYVNRLVVDGNTQELIHQRGLIVPFHGKRYVLSKIRAVKLFIKTVGKGDNKTHKYAVQLSGIADAIVLSHRNPWFSRVIAEQLARLIGVPLTNQVYGVSSVRKPDELDTPLVDRWIRDDERFDKPAPAYGTDLQETIHGSSYELSIRAEFPVLKYLIAILFLLAAAAVAPIPPTELFQSDAYRILAVFFFGTGIVLLSFVGRSSLRITANEVSFRQGYFPVRSRLRIKEIEEMVVAGDGITLIGDTRAVWIHWGGSKPASDYLEAIVPYQILRLGRYTMPDKTSAPTDSIL